MGRPEENRDEVGNAGGTDQQNAPESRSLSGVSNRSGHPAQLLEAVRECLEEVEQLRQVAEMDGWKHP